MSSSQPRVLMVLDAMLIGGTETHVVTLTKSLMQRGIHVSICAGQGDLRPAFAALGCPVHIVPFFSAYTIVQKRKLRTQIAAIVRQERITHMHIHQLHSGEIAFPVALNHRLSTVVTVHGKYYNRAALKRMKSHGAKIVSVSPPVRRWLKEQGVKALTIPNGVSLHKFYPQRSGLTAIRKGLHIASKSKVVLYAGRLAWDKADVCNRVIDVCAEIRQAGEKHLTLVVVGTGGHVASVKSHARDVEHRIGAKFVHFLGARRHLRPLYAISDVVVGTGRVALEAMACAKPVVAIGSAGVFGRIQPSRLEAAWHYYFGDHGAPYPGDSSRLQNDIRRLLSSRTKQKKDGEAGRAFVVRKFNSATIAHRVIELYRETRRLHP